MINAAKYFLAVFFITVPRPFFTIRQKLSVK